MSGPHPNGWQVGMEVIIVLTERREADVRNGTITKIGRRWITFRHSAGWAENRFDADTMRIDGGQYGSPGRVYPSMAEYEETLERNKLWADLRGRIGYQPPDHLTLDRIKAIHAEVLPK
ncbi:beta barrel domain-containing protein [Aquamicrobium zhengzhouense]|uniref:Uncharacterized protein n=1 Tax=Aquamicrobium zhengzhouense TaxID=2781738 RepID=A0ABS0S9T3_9HYPH|nr:hypothetical protein [Aquamicrobium zhengzhouense]MBI1620053.1 hypothetical protein [Aquamicrobium zhengzhouense]